MCVNALPAIVSSQSNIYFLSGLKLVSLSCISKQQHETLDGLFIHIVLCLSRSVERCLLQNNLSTRALELSVNSQLGSSLEYDS